jgi:hypothetical protein
MSLSLLLFVDALVPTLRHNTKKLLTHKLFNLSSIKSADNSDLLHLLTDEMPTIEKRFGELQEKRRNAIEQRMQNLNGAQVMAG